MNEIEKAALALCEDHWQDDPDWVVVLWEDLAPVERDAWRRSAQAVIAALRESEPAAWRYEDKRTGWVFYEPERWFETKRQNWIETPLYALPTPPETDQ